MTEHRLNTPAEQIEVLKAIIEGKAVYFTKVLGGVKEQHLFQGTMPNFNLYRYDTSTTMVRGRIQFTESRNIKGVADACGIKAEYARGTVIKSDSDTFEAWYERGELFLRKLTERPVHIVTDNTDFDTPGATKDAPVVTSTLAGTRVAYAHPVDLDYSSKTQQIAARLRGHLRAKGRRFRTAQLCQTTKNYWRVAGSDLHNHHKYTLLLVLKDCVLESTNFNLNPAELTRFTCPRNTKIVGELIEINGVQFRIHWE